MSTDARQRAAVGTLVEWFRSPVAFVRSVCGAEPEPWQTEVLEAAAASQQIALVGSKGTGKSTVQAWLVLWWLFTRPMANVAAASISGDNLADGLWKECAKWIQVSPLLSRTLDWTHSRITHRSSPSTWFASARQWSKSADPQQQANALAGLHADYVLFVLDEAGSMPMSLLATAQAALASGRDCKLVIAGNPTSREGPLYAAAVTKRANWRTFHVSGAPDDPKRSARVSVEWARDQIEQFGAESPWVRVNVFGLFPETSFNALLGPEEVEAAMQRRLREDAYSWSQKRLGIDVARFGGDRTVIFPRQGLAAFRPVIMRHDRGSSVSTDIATRVIAAKTKWGSEIEFFDATGGWAAGAVDVMRASGYGPFDVQFAAPATDPRYANTRALLWFELAKWVQNGGALPNVPELVGELTTPEYTFVNGKFQLEPKDQVKARLGRSPDLADALALTFALPDQPSASASGFGRGGVGRTLCDFDPYTEVR